MTPLGASEALRRQRAFNWANLRNQFAEFPPWHVDLLFECLVGLPGWSIEDYFRYVARRSNGVIGKLECWPKAIYAIQPNFFIAPTVHTELR